MELPTHCTPRKTRNFITHQASIDLMAQGADDNCIAEHDGHQLRNHFLKDFSSLRIYGHQDSNKNIITWSTFPGFDDHKCGQAIIKDKG